jgi:uncharacterized protein (TIGR03067 family)
MKHLTLLLLTLTLLDCGCRPRPSETGSRDTPTTASSSIEGKWVVVSSEAEGQPSPENAIRYTKITFSGEDATLEGRTQKHELRFTLDMTQQPKQINLYSKQEKVVWKGIYQVEGTSLRLSYGPPNGERPTSLDTSRAAKAILYVLKREGT